MAVFWPQTADGKGVKKRLLMVEDTQSLAITYQAYLRSTSYEVEWVDNLADARLSLEVDPPDLVLLDLELPDGNGLELLRQIKSDKGRMLVVVMTAYGSTDIAEESVAQGAFDYLTKPFNANRLLVTLRNAETNLDLSQEVSAYKSSEKSRLGDIIGNSIAMQMVYRLVEGLAKSSSPGLIIGEQGTGKKLVAQTIHSLGRYSDLPFISIDKSSIESCDSLENLAEQLAASEKEAEQDSSQITCINSGTIFIEEVCGLSLSAQKKLVEAMQRVAIEGQDSASESPCSLRILVATEADLSSEVRAGRLRADLYSQLMHAALHLPPLRDRVDDVLLLAKHFLDMFAQQADKPFLGFSDAAKVTLRNYPWPGNLSELRDCIRTIVHSQSDTLVTHEMLPDQIKQGDKVLETADIASFQSSKSAKALLGENLIEPLWLVEKNAIQNAISICEGNIIKAANLLEVAPSTIYRKLQSWSS